jgi:hypothetical protein
VCHGFFTKVDCSASYSPRAAQNSDSYTRSSQEKLDRTARKYILNVPDPRAWRQLQSYGISPVVLPERFASALLPAFVLILEAFYALEYRQALEKCRDFMNQLTALKHELGVSYDTTVRCYSILRIMIHMEMGFYLYPTDLPYPDPPHLDPVPDPQSPVSDAYILHRLLSASFDTTERAAAQLDEHGWTCEKSNAMVKNNISFFKQVLPRFKPKPQASEPLPELHVSHTLDLLLFNDADVFGDLVLGLLPSIYYQQTALPLLDLVTQKCHRNVRQIMPYASEPTVERKSP